MADVRFVCIKKSIVGFKMFKPGESIMMPSDWDNKNFEKAGSATKKKNKIIPGTPQAGPGKMSKTEPDMTAPSQQAQMGVDEKNTKAEIIEEILEYGLDDEDKIKELPTYKKADLLGILDGLKADAEG